ncbi:class I SAM-dependent methyltransferase [Streptomyces sp. NPDC020412]|uniref:class I SAM-dependent methyltransferase n=1 Tax=Streptomyces sp. NPDC020412 TaxID=3365073 RepID=UPI00378BD72D
MSGVKGFFELSRARPVQPPTEATAAHPAAERPTDEHGRSEHIAGPAEVFDALGADYERSFAHSPGHHESLRRLLAELAPGSSVLDLGCGTGRPTARTLVDAGHHVLGVDISPVMVDIAARQVPGGSFVCADVRTFDLADGSYDAVCVYFSLLQMSRDEQTRLLNRVARALVPGGRLAIATVPLDVNGLTVEFMGQPVRVTSFDAEAFTAAVTGAGFTVRWSHQATLEPADPNWPAEPHLFLLCERT